jgi:hypothetical protein
MDDRAGASTRFAAQSVADYFECEMGFKDSKGATLRDLGRALAGLGQPWLAAGDWGATPEELAATGWIAKLHASVIAKDLEFICLSGDGRIIDYGVCSKGYEHIVQFAGAVGGSPFQPHTPLAFDVSKKPSQAVQQVAAKPRMLPPPSPKYEDLPWGQAKTMAVMMLLREGNETNRREREK